MSSAVISQSPHWYYIPLRVVVLTFFATLLCFAIGLFIGICVVVIMAFLHGAHPDLRAAYRHVALPTAAIGFAIVFVSSIVAETRRYRRARTLSHIEQQIERAG